MSAEFEVSAGSELKEAPHTKIGTSNIYVESNATSNETNKMISLQTIQIRPITNKTSDEDITMLLERPLHC